MLAIRQRAYPAKHVKIAEALRELGELAAAEAKPADSLALLERALAMTDENNPEQIVLIAGLHTSIAMLEQTELDRHADALAHFARAVALVRRRSGDDSLELAILLLNYGQIRAADDLEAGLGLAREGRAILERARDKRAVSASIAVAMIEMNGKRYADAVKTASSVLDRIANDRDIEPEAIAELKWTLARALVATRGDRKRAFSLARDARQIFATLGPARAARIKQIDAWLAKP